MLCCTEQDIAQRAEWQKIAGNKEIFQIHDVRARSERLKSGKDIKAENTRKRKQDDCEYITNDGLLSGKAPQINGKGNNIFKYRDHCRKCGKGKEQEEQCAPDPSTGHLIKNVRERNEDQGWPCIRFDTEGEAGRNDDKTCHQCNKGIQKCDAECFTG